ncbi:MAG: thioesterase family protein [Burkholderiales bacterium]
MSFTVRKAIRFQHCDPAGIVFYPRYFVLMNEVVEDWFDNGLGIDFGEFHARDRLGVPMGRLECDFLAPSKVGDRLDFTLVVESLGRSSIKVAVEARCGDETRLRAKLALVLASLDTRRAVPIPEAMRAAMSRYLRDSGPGH